MQYLIYAVIGSGIVFGLIFPQIQTGKDTVPYLIGLVLFLNFSEVSVPWRKFYRKELLLTLTLSALIMPYLFYRWFSSGLDTQYRIGLLLTAAAPSGIMALVLGRFMADIDYGLVLSNFIVTTFGSVIYIPLTVKWLVGAAIQIQVSQMLIKTAAIILLPYGASFIVRNGLPQQWTAAVKRWSKPLVMGSIFFIVAIVTSAATRSLHWNHTLITLILLVLAVYIIQKALAYLASFYFWDRRARRTLALIASSRNNNVALGIATLHFAPATTVPCIVGFILHHVTNAVWLYLLRK
jgi:BASS family bile acid:Na+ symporter